MLVYRPETRGRIAPEGGGSINRNIPTRGVIINSWLLGGCIKRCEEWLYLAISGYSHSSHLLRVVVDL